VKLVSYALAGILIQDSRWRTCGYKSWWIRKRACDSPARAIPNDNAWVTLEWVSEGSCVK